jgi:AraC family transcriptional regulator
MVKALIRFCQNYNKQHYMKKINPQKHISTINQIAQYIYDNIEEAISLDLLAEQFSVSKYHLNRLFYAQTGMNLGEFMQRRRMELAYELIRSQDLSVIDAALKVGYGSPASFSRAFRKLFGIEPNKVKLKQTPVFALAALIKKPNREVIEAEIIDLPAQHLQGLYGKGFEEQTYFKVAQGLYHEIAGHLGLTNGFDFNKYHIIGISLESPWRTEHTESKFFAGVKLSNNTEITGSGLESHILAAGSWARFEHKGPYNTMWQTILSIYSNWVEQNNRKLRDCAIVQHYVNDVNCTPLEELLTYIYLPIES